MQLVESSRVMASVEVLQNQQPGRELVERLQKYLVSVPAGVLLLRLASREVPETQQQLAGLEAQELERLVLLGAVLILELVLAVLILALLGAVQQVRLFVLAVLILD